MWVLGMGVGLAVFVLGAVFSTLAFIDVRYGGMLLGFALAAVGNGYTPEASNWGKISWIWHQTYQADMAPQGAVLVAVSAAS